MNIKNGRGLSLVLALALMLEIFAPVFSIEAYGSKDSVIDSIEIVEASKQLNNKKTYNLEGSWSVDDGSKKKGDQFVLDLSSKIEFNTPSDELFLISPSGRIYAEGRLDRVSGKIVFTFTDLVEEDKNVQGSFYINGLTIKDRDEGKGIVKEDLVIKEDDKTIYEKEVEVNTGSGVVVGGPSDLNVNVRKSDSILSHFKDGEARWSIDLNATGEKDRIDGVIELEDRMGDGHHLVPDSLTIQFKDRFIGWSLQSNVVQNGKIIESELDRFPGASVEYDYADDGKSFKLRINTGGYAALVQYSTRLEKPIKRFSYDNYLDIKYIDNDGKLVEEKQQSELTFADMGGTGQGILGSGNIRLKKIDENGKPLDGAKFEIANYKIENGEMVELSKKEYETKDGLVVLENTSGGIYGIREIEAPEGYIGNDEEIIRLIDFSETESLKRLVTNEKGIENALTSIADWYNKQDDAYRLGYDIQDLANRLGNSRLESLGRGIMTYANTHDKDWLGSSYVKPAENKLKELQKASIEAKNSLVDMGYSVDDDAFVIELENRSIDSTRIDFELRKKWEIPSNHRKELEGKVVGKFKLFAYKDVNGRPRELNEDDDKEVLERLEKLYEIKYSGKDEDVLKIEGLPYTDAKGHKYIYNVLEISDLENFEKEEGQVIENKKTIINRYIPPKTLDIDVEKIWEDDNNIQKKRPDTIAVHLLADGERIESIDLGEADNWSHSFKDLPKYRDDGGEILYSIEEDKVEGYTSRIEGFKIINSLDELPEEPKPEENLVELKVRKVWEDADKTVITDSFKDHQGVSIELYYNVEGEEPRKYDYIDEVHTNGDGGILLNSSNDWSYNFKDLPKYSASGEEYIYTVVEPGFEDFDVKIKGSMEDEEIVIVNKIESRSIDVEKQWKNSDNEAIEDIDVEKVEIELLANKHPVDRLELNKENNWRGSFKDLPEYIVEDGELVHQDYTIREVNVADGYRPNILAVESGFIVENIREEASKKLLVKKEWEVREESKKTPIEVGLVENGELVEGTKVTLSEDNDWTYEYTNLDPRLDYEVRELTELAWIDEVKYDQEDDIVTITNIEKDPEEPKEGEPGEKLKKTVGVRKEWNILDGSKKVPIEVVLIKSGEEVEASKVTLSDANNWSHEYKDLDYDGDYRVKEITSLDWIDNVEYDYEGNLFIIRNIEYPKEEEPDKPTEPEEPKEEEPDKPTEPEEPKEEEPDKPTEPEEPKEEEPEKPTEPEEPKEEEPEKPTEPEEPKEEEPEKPTEPEEPREEEPEKPTEPEEPKEEEPDKPMEPEEPREEEPEKLPKTGEDSNILIVIGILALAFGLALGKFNRKESK